MLLTALGVDGNSLDPVVAGRWTMRWDMQTDNGLAAVMYQLILRGLLRWGRKSRRRTARVRDATDRIRIRLLLVDGCPGVGVEALLRLLR